MVNIWNMYKKKFNPLKNIEDIHFHLKGTLRVRLYLYMEDNQCGQAEALRDAVRILTTSQEEERKKGRKPLTE